jgi:hypothetical protein
MTNSTINQQRLDELAGTRSSRVSGKAAVRKSDMAAIVSLPGATSSQLTSGATVTADDYNALQADYAALLAAIVQIAGNVKS